VVGTTLVPHNLEYSKRSLQNTQLLLRYFDNLKQQHGGCMKSVFSF